MNLDTLKKLTKARATLLLEQPFFGVLALRLQFRDMSDEMRAAFIGRGLKPTMAVDGRSIFFDEEFVESLEIPRLRAALAHEVGHCVFDHIGRRGARNPSKWNAAGDYVINDILKEAGFDIGPDWLLNPAFKDMTADRVYALLPDGDDGGGGALDEILDGTPDPADQAMQQNEWKVATVQAANAAKMQGKLAGSLERFVDSLTGARADWRAQLRRFITERAKDDYTWSRPSRRVAGMPSLYSENMGEIAVVIDTSGSIDGPTLSAFTAEIQAIRDAVRPSLTRVIYCDANVNHVDEFQPEDMLATKMHGGGGTDFRPPFKLIDQQGHQPACLVYLTDLYGPFPQTPPDYPVIWCATTDEKTPWGETVRIEV